MAGSSIARAVPQFVRSRIRLIFLTWLALFLGIYATLGVMNDVYESETSLRLDLGSASAPNGEAPDVRPNDSRRHELAAEAQVLRSRQLIEQVVDTLSPEAFLFEPQPPTELVELPRYYVRRLLHGAEGLSRSMLNWLALRPELTRREMAILTLDESLEVETVGNSGVVTARLLLPDAALSAEALNTLIRAYLETRVEVRQSSSAIDFLRARATEVEHELAVINKKEEQLFAEWGLGDLETQRSVLGHRMNETQSAIDARRSERAMLLEERTEMERRLEALPEDIQRSEVRVRNPVRAEIEARITELKVTREQLLGRYRPEAVPVKNIDTEIAGLEGLLAHEEATHFESVRTETHPLRRAFGERTQTLSVRIAGLTASTAELEQIVSDLRNDLERLNAQQRELESLARERQLTEQRYRAYSQRIQNAKISAELKGLRAASVTLLTPPAVPLESSYPRRSLVMLFSIPLALFAGVSLAALAEWTDDRVRTEQDLVELEGVDYLGVFELSPASLPPESSNER